jgi:hypothetical protein
VRLNKEADIRELHSPRNADPESDKLGELEKNIFRGFYNLDKVYE